MVYRARVQNGQVVIEGGEKLPEGAELRVEVVAEPSATEGQTQPEPGSIADLLKDFIGVIDDLPPDMSLNHDHYLYGAPKRK